MPSTDNVEVSLKQVWFVTGVGRGLGLSIARAALEAGRRVVGTVRDEGQAVELQEALGDDAFVLTADVTDPAAVRRAVRAATERFGRIDVLINNAGYTLVSGVEDASDADIRAQFETNTFGTIDVTRAVLPGMRSQGSGRIVMISSVAGASAAPGMGYYAATKHAVEGFAESLSKEVASLGIKVSMVQPGLFRTDTLGSSMRSVTPGVAYDGSVGALMNALSGLSGSQPGDPAELGRSIVTLVDTAEPPLRVPIDPGASGSVRGRLEQQLSELEIWGPRLATQPIA